MFHYHIREREGGKYLSGYNEELTALTFVSDPRAARAFGFDDKEHLDWMVKHIAIGCDVVVRSDAP